MGGVDEGESGESSHDGVRAFARHAAAARGGNMSALSEEFKALLQAMVRADISFGAFVFHVFYSTEDISRESCSQFESPLPLTSLTGTCGSVGAPLRGGVAPAEAVV